MADASRGVATGQGFDFTFGEVGARGLTPMKGVEIMNGWNNMMNGWDGGMGGAFTWLFMLLLAVAVIVGVVLVIRGTGRGER